MCKTIFPITNQWQESHDILIAHHATHHWHTSCWSAQLVASPTSESIDIYGNLWPLLQPLPAFCFFSMAFCFLAKHWPAPSLLLPGLCGHGGRLFLFLLLPCHSHAKKERSSTPATLQHIATCCWPACNQITPWSLHSGSSESHRLHLSLPGFSQTKHSNLSGYASACQELQELAVLILN